MENKNSDIVRDRSERIRLARESCHKNIGISSSKNKNTSDQDPKKLKVYSSEKTINKNRNVSSQNSLDMKNLSVKLLMIRSVCAVLLFLLIVVADQFNITYQEFGSNTIIELISSKKEVTQVEEFISDLTKEKIISVFNRLDK